MMNGDVVYSLTLRSIGKISVRISNGMLTRVSFGGNGRKGVPRKIRGWFEAYMGGKHLPFPYPISQAGTKFERRVWSAISKIPYGETRTYKELAEEIGSPKSWRAVGNTCKKNKVPIVIPCHRVVAKGGIGGFSQGLSHKKGLLNLEAMLLKRKNKP